MDTYYQVVFREGVKLHILENHISNYQAALTIMDDFLLTLEYIDGDFSDVQIYEINKGIS